MREDIDFQELIEKIDLILNSPKPLPFHMKEERKLAELIGHLKEIPKYDRLKQFEPLFDKEPFLMQFLTGTDFTKLLKIIDRRTMKYQHWQHYTPLMMIVVNPNIANFEKTMVIDRMLEMGCRIDQCNFDGENALLMAVKRNNRVMMEYLLKKGACPNMCDNWGVTPLMVATFNSQLYNMAILHFYRADIANISTEFEFDIFDIADVTQNPTTKELLIDFAEQ